ncbi:MAG: carbamoyltransferase HypF [Saprospiraceae bacterium]|nr:carbamoyltransferase HypF [Saprospiraceae bacterium]
MHDLINNGNIECRIIEVHGLVQGVGFRPFIYRIATRFNLFGWVENRTDCVKIKVQGDSLDIENFIQAITNEAPVASNIRKISSVNANIERFSNFCIVKSNDNTKNVTEISPDIAVCSDCLDDMKSQNHRINYPFINCTNCGPRFSIIKDLPYDREKTTMNKFPMCEVCKGEYEDILNRRFHAQPVACCHCGPQYSLIINDKIIDDLDEILVNTSDLISNGKIVGIKGVGGFFIACDAQNEETVLKLRELKNREAKPFAVMFRDIESVKEYALTNEISEKSLRSWQRPIVLLEQKKVLALSVNKDLNSIGIMLPYMPIHYLIFERLSIPAIVLTSGNFADEPIIIDNEIAEQKLLKICDALLTYNRDIFNRTDDSVVMEVNGVERVSRRSRGYAPSPIQLFHNVDGILAAGAEMKNSFCIGKSCQAIMSQHIGELNNIETYSFYKETIERFKSLFRVQPEIIVHDLHPDYLSTKYANESNLKKVAVQHHHAHIASCMAEHNLNETVIGVSFDGTGLGTDGNIWGSEFLLADLNNFTRFTHFDYIPMPGGDKAAKEPWRMAVSYLYKVFGNDFVNLDLAFLKNIKTDNIELITQAIDKKINCPLTSSSGRLFDAIAAIINLCTVSTFEAEAPIRLESIIDKSCKEYYNYDRNDTISFASTIKEIVQDIKNGMDNSIISAKFHNTVIDIVRDVVIEMRLKYYNNNVVLSGGTFQNKYLLGRLEKVLTKNGFNVYTHSKVPTNDGGIALGQLVIAAKRRELKCV